MSTEPEPIWLVFGRRGTWGHGPLIDARDRLQLFLTGGDYLHVDLVVGANRMGIWAGETAVIEPFTVFPFMSTDVADWVRLDPALFDVDRIRRYILAFANTKYSLPASLESCFLRPLAQPDRERAMDDDRRLRPFCSAIALSALRVACTDPDRLADVVVQAITPYRLWLLIHARKLVAEDGVVVKGSEIMQYM